MPPGPPPSRPACEADVDDGGAIGHERKCGLGHGEDGLHVEREDLVPEGVVHFVHLFAGDEAADDVDEDVDGIAEMFLRGDGEGADGGGVKRVDLLREGRVAERA